jgi:hypothetical protein
LIFLAIQMDLALSGRVCRLHLETDFRRMKSCHSL